MQGVLVEPWSVEAQVQSCGFVDVIMSHPFLCVFSWQVGLFVQGGSYGCIICRVGFEMSCLCEMLGCALQELFTDHVFLVTFYVPLLLDLYLCNSNSPSGGTQG